MTFSYLVLQFLTINAKSTLSVQTVYYCIMNSTVYSQPLREATWERRKTASTVVKNMRFAVQTQTVFPPSDLPFKRS